MKASLSQVVTASTVGVTEATITPISSQGDAPRRISRSNPIEESKSPEIQKREKQIATLNALKDKIDNEMIPIGVSAGEKDKEAGKGPKRGKGRR